MACNNVYCNERTTDPDKPKTMKKYEYYRNKKETTTK
jgi:hypothetical protein